MSVEIEQREQPSNTGRALLSPLNGNPPLSWEFNTDELPSIANGNLMAALNQVATFDLVAPSSWKCDPETLLLADAREQLRALSSNVSHRIDMLSSLHRKTDALRLDITRYKTLDERRSAQESVEKKLQSFISRKSLLFTSPYIQIVDSAQRTSKNSRAEESPDYSLRTTLRRIGKSFCGVKFSPRSRGVPPAMLLAALPVEIMTEVRSFNDLHRTLMGMRSEYRTSKPSLINTSVDRPENWDRLILRWEERTLQNDSVCLRCECSQLEIAIRESHRVELIVDGVPHSEPVWNCDAERLAIEFMKGRDPWALLANLPVYTGLWAIVKEPAT